MLNKKEIKRKIRALRKVKKDTRVGTKERRNINKIIRKLQKEIDTACNYTDPKKKALIDKINAVYSHVNDLWKFTMEQLEHHYEKITTSKKYHL